MHSALTKISIVIVHTVGSLKTRTIYLSIAFVFLFKVEKQKSKGRNKKMTCLYLHDLMLNEKSNAGTQPFIPKWSL